MSLNIGELVGYIKLDHTGVGQGITAAQRDMRSGMDRMARDAQQQGERTGKAAGEGLTGAFKGSIGNLAKIALGAFAVERVVTGLRAMKDSASDLNETTSMSSVIFGRNAQAMKAWAQNGPRALGLSTEATLRYSASLADMLLQLGYADSAAADASRSTLQLAADLGSFKNLDTADVMERISAGLRGEYDSLQLLIPNINAARVEHEALAATGKRTASALTAQEKAAATLAIIQKDGARASGDFARTKNGEANASKTAAAATEDLKAKVGQGLLPAYTALVVFGRDEVIPFLTNVVDYMGAAADAADPLTDAIGGVVGAFRDLPPEIQAATLGLITLIALRGRVEAFGDALNTKIAAGGRAAASGLDSLRLGLMYASDNATTAAGRFGAVTKSIGASAGAGLRGAASGLLGVLGGPWGLAFAGAVAVVGTYIKRQQEARQRVEQLTATLDEQTGAVTKNTRELVRNRLETEGVLRSAQKLGINLQDVYDAALGNADAMARVNARIRELNPASDSYAKTVNRGATANAALKSEIGNVLGAIEQQTGELDSASAAAGRKAAINIDTAATETKVGGAMADTTDKVKDQKDALKDAAQAALDLTEAKLAAFDAEIGYQQALDDTTAARKQNGKTATKDRKELDLNTQAGRDNAKALSDLAAAAKRRNEEDLNGGASLTELRTNMKAAKDDFIAQAEKMGLSEEAARKMAREFGLTKGTVDNLAKSVEDLPAAKQIRIEAETKAAQDRLATLKRQLDDIKSKSVVVTTFGRFVNDGPQAGGGRNTAGGSTVNSEDGNVLHFDGGGRLADPRRAFIARSGTPTRVFNEPPTGGEGFVPLGVNKRPTAVPVLGQIANELGFDLVKRGTTPTAGAATSGGGSSATHYHHYDIGSMAVADFSGFQEVTDEERRVHNMAGGA